MAYRRGADGEILAEERDEVPKDKEDGMQRWKKEMELRFLRAGDEDFDYTLVDENEDLDDRNVLEREEEEKWFEEEEAQWVSSRDGSESRPPAIEGETGVQDF